ncbi:hypothetical protein DFQ27_005833 [Actinomortierella ambigua]|uniref:Uncharacterized protein n=1 Tax=Actinomortierella ambigua TaxID=1343610 RepID=A0A9P6UCA5_9FUNG|nr:hypothetical protein DFQ27_005833 [Actinomortierella ambigua]
MAFPFGRQRALLAALLLFSIGSLLTISLHPTFTVDQDKGWIASRRKPWSTDNDPKSSASLLKSPSGDHSLLDEPATGNTVVVPDRDLSNLPSVAWLKEHLRGTFLDITADEDLDNPLRPIRGTEAAEQSRLRLEESSSNTDDDDDEDDGNGDGSEEEEPIDLNDNSDSSSSDKTPKQSQNLTDDENNNNNNQAGQKDGDPDITEEDEDEDEDEELDEEAKALREKEKMEQAEVDDELAGDAEEDDEQVEVTDDQPDGNETTDDGDDMDGGAAEDEDDVLSDEGDDTTDAEEDSEEQVSRDRSLADFDLENDLPTDESYMLFVPSGDTIEQQFYSLVTAVWMARHANRTLLIPPPIMPSPILQPLLAPDYVPQKSRLVWSSYYDLKTIMNAQKIRFLDSVRHRLHLTFTDDMLQEEADPTSARQGIPNQVKELQFAWTPIQCHGPPTAGSWKTLDFVGRHFLNAYGLQAQFQILGDRYWNLTAAAIHKHWRYIPTPAVPTAAAAAAEVDERDRDHHQQLICISGADLVGLNDPEMEEQLWQEVGSRIRFSRTTHDKAWAGIQRALRGLEKPGRMHGFIGVHFDKMPPKEVCHPETAAKEGKKGSDDHEGGDGKDAKISLASSPVASSMRAQCRWTVEMVSKRVAMLQQEEGKSRPVVVTTTETDPEILQKMDMQPGWFRIEHGVDDDAGVVGLFDPLGLSGGGENPNESTTNTNANTVVSGGYAHQVARANVHAAAAIFVGSRHSPLDVHVAFRLKNQGRGKLKPARWELY